MSFKEKLLYHQIHPLKLASDILGSLAALPFYWFHHFLIGVSLSYIPTLLVSFFLISYADLGKLKDSRMGKYIHKNMTRTLEAIRFLATFIMLSGAWYHFISLILGGIVIILLCWTWGLFLQYFAKKK